MNRRPPAPKAGALPGCATPRAEPSLLSVGSTDIARCDRAHRTARLTPLLASATAMADVQPLRALHYDLASSAPSRTSWRPPYDVIDADSARRAAGALALQRRRHRPAPRASPIPTRPRGELFESWQLQGALVRDREPALWAHTQDYTGPDGQPRTRRGFFCRVRIEDYGPGRVRPHERTHPGPKEDRLRLDARHAGEHLADLLALLRPLQRGLERAGAGHRSRRRGARSPTPTAPSTACGASPIPQAIAAVQAATRDAELLIADGHHRYETMRAYAEEIGGEGEHRYILMCLVALEDPGLTVFPTHRLVSGLDAERREALAQALARDFEIDGGAARARSRRRPATGRCSSATSTRTDGRALPADAEGPGDRRRRARRTLRGLPPPRHRACWRRCC